MAEVAGLIFGFAGTVGVLGQIFDGCIKAYNVFTSAANLGRDSERLLCKVRIEEMRLMVWGRKWGIGEGKLQNEGDPYMAPGGHGEMERALAEMVLSQLFQTIMDFNKLQDKYGLCEETPGSVDREAYKRSTADPKEFVRAKWGTDLKLRAKWVISDKEKFGLLLADLQYFNDRLERLFLPADMVNLQRTWTNELLQGAERDLGKLQLLESAASDNYPSLNTFAQLKQLRINLDAREPSKKILSSSELKIQRWRLKMDDIDTEERLRSKAIYQKPISSLRGTSVSEEIEVFVEWTTFDPEISMDARLHLYQRIDNLARMLHSSSNRHPDLHTLDCLGYVEDTQKNRYGIVYSSIPTTERDNRFQTLANLIGTIPAPDLDIRFKLAHTLAIALWSLHSLDWLHKTLCPYNVLFFAVTEHASSQTRLALVRSKNAVLSKPYLAGFDSSRPDHLDEMTVASKNEIGQDLYRHPSSLGLWRQTYRKAFDIYSLGLVLLEIGLWKSLDILQKGKCIRDPATFREKVTQSVVPTLGAKAGPSYRRVVERCLTYEEPKNDGEVSPHQLLEWVVLMLERLKV